MNLKTILFLIAIVVTNLTFAAPAKAATPLKSILAKKLRIPSELKVHGMKEKVKVVFTINEQKKIQVIEIHTDNQKLRESVKAQMEKINFPHAEVFNEEYTVELDFKVK